MEGGREDRHVVTILGFWIPCQTYQTITIVFGVVRLPIRPLILTISPLFGFSPLLGTQKSSESPESSESSHPQNFILRILRNSIWLFSLIGHTSPQFEPFYYSPVGRDNLNLMYIELRNTSSFSSSPSRPSILTSSCTPAVGGGIIFDPTLNS